MTTLCHERRYEATVMSMNNKGTRQPAAHLHVLHENREKQSVL